MNNLVIMPTENRERMNLGELQKKQPLLKKLQHLTSLYIS